MKLTNSEMTKAIQTYARKNNHYASTVRTISSLRYAAFAEYKAKMGK